MSETYTAPQRDHLDGDALVFDRSLGRARDSVVLPRGWYLTSRSTPAVIHQTSAGLTRIDFVKVLANRARHAAWPNIAHLRRTIV